MFYLCFDVEQDTFFRDGKSGGSSAGIGKQKVPDGFAVKCRADDSSVHVLAVGDKVCVEANYQSVGDASGGPLSPGQTGEVMSTSGSSVNISADHNGRTWHYNTKALLYITKSKVKKKIPGATSATAGISEKRMGKKVRELTLDHSEDEHEVYYEELADLKDLIDPQSGKIEVEEQTVYYVRLKNGAKAPTNQKDGRVLTELTKVNPLCRRIDRSCSILSTGP